MTQQISAGDAAVGEKCLCRRAGLQGPIDTAGAPASSAKWAELLAKGVQGSSPPSHSGALIFSSDESRTAIDPLGAHVPAPRLVTHRPLHPASYRKGRASGHTLLKSYTAFKMNLTVNSTNSTESRQKRPSHLRLRCQYTGEETAGE